jgi:predicted metal-dependent hydrolase
MPELNIGQNSIPYARRQSARARRLRLIVGPEGVEVVVPSGMREREVGAFLEQHRDWIRAKLEKFAHAADRHPGAVRLADGVAIPFRGEPTPLAVVRTDRVRPKVVDGDGFRVELPKSCPAADLPAVTERVLTAWLKRQAKSDAEAAIAAYGPAHGYAPTGLQIKDQKRLWGSCTAKGVINLNWRLVLAPIEVFDYVVVHELCHLRHRHHQPPFWRAVEQVMPDYASHRAWLKSNGHLLTLTRP